ncbi:MAG: beta-ketoacyl-ACP synthase II [Chloroflexia bacterium]
MARRVVVTGMGAISPLGLDVPTLWQGLLEGRSGAAPITLFDAGPFDTRFACEVKGFDPLNYMDRKEARRSDRYTQMAIAAAEEAMRNSGLRIDANNAERVGVIIGSGVGGLMTIREQFYVLVTKGPRAVSPFTIPMIIGNMAAGQVAMRYGAKGINYCTTSACASSAHAIGEAFEAIRRGVAEAIIVGGSEAPIDPFGVASFCAARALSTRNEAPEKACRPFDAQRDGFVMAEGAGVLVLEELDFARRRGANILAEVLGYGATADAYHITAPAPEGEGAARSMRLALQQAGLQPTEVDYINAHGTSTPLNDVTETQAIKAVFGEYAYRVPISSTKSMVGHLLGAAGAIESIVCIQTILTGIIHPTINYEFPDPECDLDYVPNVPRRANVRIALSNSLGFGGHNVTLIFGRYEE